MCCTPQFGWFEWLLAIGYQLSAGRQSPEKQAVFLKYIAYFMATTHNIKNHSWGVVFLLKF